MNERFGLRFILINARLEGVAFAHEPSTTASAVASHLAPLMTTVGADAGFLFDVDSDRVAMATEKGEPVSEEMVLPLAGRLGDAARTGPPHHHEPVFHGPHRRDRPPPWRQSHSRGRGRHTTIDALASYRAEQIAIAGEGTGAVMLPQFRFVYDGIASMLAVLSMMVERKATLSEILAAYPRYSI